MSNATKKTGRKQIHFINPATGLPVVGLSRRPSDGRWRIIGTQQTFTEPDPAKAIKKFLELAGQGEGFHARMERHRADFGQKATTQGQMVEWARALILDTPMLAAKTLGIEWLAYGPTLQAPQPSTTVAKILETWNSFTTVTSKQKRKIAATWNYFVDTTGISTLKEITGAVAVKFRTAVYAKYSNGKTQSHIFNGTRSILRFVRQQAVAMDEITVALKTLELLTPNETTQTIAPDPIERDDWQKLLDTAEGDDLAMILLMLNGAYYLQEVVRIRWEDIDEKQGALITHRAKKGKVVRIAALWQETLEALAKLPRKGEYLFYSYNGLPLTVSGASKRFRKLRKTAKVSPDVEAQQLRDGAITAAAQANIEERLCKLLEGHRTHGVTDKYAKRNPRMVAPVCEAIRAAYFGNGEGDKK